MYYIYFVTLKSLCSHFCWTLSTQQVATLNFLFGMIWSCSALFVVYLFLQNYFLSRVGISFGLSHLLEKSVVTKLASTMMVVLALRCLLCFLFSFLSVAQKVFGAS